MTNSGAGGYEAILFDFDGVLVDSEPLHHACWREVVEPHGIALDWPMYEKHCLGVSDRAMLEALCALREPKLDIELLWAKYPAKQSDFRRRMEKTLPFFPEAAAFFESLAGYRLAVVSSSARREVEPLLEVAGLRRCFSAVVCGEDVARHKPAPDPYLLAVELLGTRNVLVVEDSEAGVASAKAAGLAVIRVASSAEVPARVRAATGVSC